MAYTFDDMCYSDLHKDAYGFRPGEANYRAWVAMSDDEKQAEWERLLVVLERSIADDKLCEQESIEKFESTVEAMCIATHQDRETIVRWMIDASDAQGDTEFYCYLEGLPYHYFDKKD